MTQPNMPADFFWGNSVSSMQTEGAWQEDGKGLSVYDVRPATDHTMDWHDAIDEYHRYAEDLDLMADMGMNMYRIQISWSRVVPDGDGAFNEAGIQYYSDLIDAMIARGIEPMVNLYHFDMPLELQQTGGWLSRDTVDAYVAYAYENGLTKGVSLEPGKESFDPNAQMDAKSYATLLLRTLGYNDSEGDFQWSAALDKALSTDELDRAADSLLAASTGSCGEAVGVDPSE